MMSSVCRLCMNRYASAGSMENIFLGEAFIVETIRTVTQIEVVQGDGLPQYACLLCVFKLNDAKNFIQSCIECNEKLKLECLVRTTALVAPEVRRSSVYATDVYAPDHLFLASQSDGPCLQNESEYLPVLACPRLDGTAHVGPSISTAVDAINSLSPVAIPAAGFLRELKTELFSRDVTESAAKIGADGTDVQCQSNTMKDLDSIAESNNAVKDHLKTEPIEESGLLDETDAADISRLAMENDNEVEQDGKTENLAMTHTEHRGPMIGLHMKSESAQTNTSLEIKREQIAAYYEESRGETILLAEADKADVTNLHQRDSRVFNIIQETNSIARGEVDSVLMDAAPPLNATLSATCPSQAHSLVASTKIPQLCCTGTKHSNTLNIRPEANDKMQSSTRSLQVLSKQSSLRCHQRPQGLLNSFSRRKQRLQCPKCLQVFLQPSILRQHACVLTGSSGAFGCSQPFNCSDCSEGFSSRNSLEMHRKTHKKNLNGYQEIGSESHCSDFDLNSSDSESSIFELSIPDSEDSNQDLKSSYSESSVVKYHLDPYSDCCEMDVVSMESEDCGSRYASDLDGPDMGTSLESEGSGLRPNSDWERSGRDTSVESGGSITNLDICFNLDLGTAASPVNPINFGQEMVTSSPNADWKKNMECQVGATQTLALQTTRLEHSLSKLGEQFVGPIAKPGCLEENLSIINGSGEDDVTHNASTVGVESSAPILRSGRGTCLTEHRLCIRGENTVRVQRKKKTDGASDDEIPLAKRVCRYSSELGSLEKFSKGKGLPCVMPGESDGVLASVGPICERTRGRTLAEGVSNTALRVELGYRCDIVRDRSKTGRIGKGKKQDSGKQGDAAVPINLVSCKVNEGKNGNCNDGEMSNSMEVNQKPSGSNLDIAVTKEMVGITVREKKVGLKKTSELISKHLYQEKGNSKEKNGRRKEMEKNVQKNMKTNHIEHKTKITVGEVTELKRNGGRNGKLMNIVKRKNKTKKNKKMADSTRTVKETAQSKDMTAVFESGSENSSDSKSETVSSNEKGRVFKVVEGSSCLGVSGLRKVSQRRSVCSAVPEVPYQCWECARKFALGSELITHFRQHLQATLTRHTP